MEIEHRTVGGRRARPKYLAHARQSTILEVLEKAGSVTVVDLAERLSVSGMTIRRDLIEMEKAGWLSRTHGGAVRSDDGPQAGSHFDRQEPAFHRRQLVNVGLKERIAAMAAEIAAPMGSFSIDVGTTTYMLAEKLTDGCTAKVFTNNIRASTVLAAKGIEVYLAGGRIRPEEMSTGGPTAVAQFSEYWFDAAFIGVSGLTTLGAFDYSVDEANLKRVYLTQATRKIALCDSSKFDRMSLVNIGALADFTTLITDSAPLGDLAEALDRAGVEIIVAD